MFTFEFITGFVLGIEWIGGDGEDDDLIYAIAVDLGIGRICYYKLKDL